MEKIDRPASPFDEHYFLKHTPGGHDHDQKTHGDGGSGEKPSTNTRGQRTAAHLYGDDWYKPFKVEGKTLTPNKTRVRIEAAPGREFDGTVTAVWRNSEEEWEIEVRDDNGKLSVWNTPQLKNVL
jgi:hypothetical protein